MKYIKKIILENFQSHKYTEIELNEKLNIIVGPSDSGKTAILRGIKWALYNEPSGDFFIREGENEVTVSLVFSDNTKLTRYRSRSKNVYRIEYNNGEVLRLEGFGTGVPEEVKEAIGIYKIHLDDKETNSVSLAEQLEGPFLLSEKTSTRASAIGQLVGVDVIDQALGETLKDLKNYKQEKKELEIEIDELSEEIKTYNYLDDLKDTINKLTRIRDKVSSYTNILNKLVVSNTSLKDLHNEINELAEIKSKLSRIEGVHEILTSIEYLNTKYWQMNKYKGRLVTIKENISENEIILDKLKNIYLAMNTKNKLMASNKEYNKLINANKQYKSIKVEKNDLENKLSIISNYLKEEDNIREIQKKIEKLIHLINLKDKYLKVKYSIGKGNKYIKQFRFLDDSIDKSKSLEKSIDILRNINKLYNEMLIISKNKRNSLECLNKLKLDIKKSLERYREILNDIEKCPLCFSEINSENIEHIVEHFIGG